LSNSTESTTDSPRPSPTSSRSSAPLRSTTTTEGPPNSCRWSMDRDRVSLVLSFLIPPSQPSIRPPAEVQLTMSSPRLLVYSAATRKIAIFVADGFDVKVYGAIYAAVKAAGALPFTVGSKQKVKGSDGQLHKGEFTLEVRFNSPCLSSI
jgi:hypothetical protein